MRRNAVVLVAMGGLAAVVAGNIRLERPAVAQVQTEAASDVSSSIPLATELPGFRDYLVQTSRAQAHFFAIRKTDKLSLKIDTYCFSSDEDALQAEERPFSMRQGAHPPEGCPSGQPLGQKVWHSKDKGQTVWDGYQLIARDGRSMVCVQLLATLPAAPDGTAIHVPIADSDMMMAEAQARLCLKKLTDLGYTSQSLNPAP